jgi:cyanophycinase
MLADPAAAPSEYSPSEYSPSEYSPSESSPSASLERLTWTPKLDAVPEPEPQSMLLVCDDRLAHEIPDEFWSSTADTMRRYLALGATVGFVGPASVAVGKTYSKPDPKSPQNAPKLAQGLGLFPDAWIHFTDQGDCDANLCHAMQADARTVLIGISKDSAMVLQGRKGTVYGPGAATAWVPAHQHLPEASQRIETRGLKNRNAPENFLLDWTQWRRQAIERTLEIFPPAERQTPNVPNGTLIIVGGGGMPSGLMQRFVDLAGGEQAQLVYVPCSEDDDMSSDTRLLELWKQMGAKSCSLLHTKNRQVANEDERFLEPLKQATGIWFGGGRQWNLADSYYGTKAHLLMKQVLTRGGVIGGSSAGASIQGNYLARATPIENFRIMAPGYERGGLGFLNGVAIDQHFTQRRRQKDLRSLVETYPQMLGIGIDETTAILVQQSTAEILGPGTVTFQWQDESSRQIGEFIGSQGQQFDLATRMELAQPTEKTDSLKTKTPKDP